MIILSEAGCVEQTIADKFGLGIDSIKQRRKLLLCCTGFKDMRELKIDLIFNGVIKQVTSAIPSLEVNAAFASTLLNMETKQKDKAWNAKKPKQKRKDDNFSSHI